MNTQKFTVEPRSTVTVTTISSWREIEELNAEWREIDERLAGAEREMNRWESIAWFTIGALSGFAGAWAYAVEVLG